VIAVANGRMPAGPAVLVRVIDVLGASAHRETSRLQDHRVLPGRSAPPSAELGYAILRSCLSTCAGPWGAANSGMVSVTLSIRRYRPTLLSTDGTHLGLHLTSM
jgi:hypothetical protein